MRVSLNLASRPYVELRPLYKRLRLVIAVLAVTAVAFWLVLRIEYVRAKSAQAKVDAIQAQVTRMRSEETRDQSEMQQPKEAGILRQAQFLNQLYLRKAFSWTAVMMDLEQVLPAGVQVTNIDPSPAKDGHVTVRLRVLGPHDKGVDLMRNLEKSKRFLTPRLTGESAENSGNQNASFRAAEMVNGVNFEIIAEYNPLPLTIAKPADAASKTGKEKTVNGKTANTADAPAKKVHKHTTPAPFPKPRVGPAALPPHGGAQ